MEDQMEDLAEKITTGNATNADKIDFLKSLNVRLKGIRALLKTMPNKQS